MDKDTKIVAGGRVGREYRYSANVNGIETGLRYRWGGGRGEMDRPRRGSRADLAGSRESRGRKCNNEYCGELDCRAGCA